MNTTGIIGAVIAAIGSGGGLAALVTWLVARRRASGRIDTSDASQLWQESQSMRSDMRTEIVGLRAELAESRQETAELRTELVAARAETRALRVELQALRKRLATSEGRIDQIEGDAYGG